MKSKTGVAISLIVVLFACATSPETIQKEMASWEGRPVKELIDFWGIPDKQETFEGKRYYTWVYNATRGTVVVPDVSSNSNTPTRGKGQHTVLAQEYCQRIAQVSDANVVQHITWEGDSCGGFGRK